MISLDHNQPDSRYKLVQRMKYDKMRRRLPFDVRQIVDAGINNNKPAANVWHEVAEMFDTVSNPVLKELEELLSDVVWIETKNVRLGQIITRDILSALREGYRP